MFLELLRRLHVREPARQIRIRVGLRPRGDVHPVVHSVALADRAVCRRHV
ncbi:hypothetical protein ABTZ93_12005 [Streptomyces sp. NPDC097941]